MGKKTKLGKKKNTNKGITLIALVITIIVLLILAGISIATLTGENGILSKANKAKEETERGMAKEKVQLAVMASYGNNGRLDYNELKDNLDNVEGITNVPNSITKESFPLKVNVDGYQVTIEENGKVTIEGEKTGTVPTPLEPITIEEAKQDGKVLDENNPVTIKDKYDNKIVVPEGFKIASDSAEDVTGGVVIEDGSNSETLGSQFVWIPVGEIKGADGITKTIELNRYLFADDGTVTGKGTDIISNYFSELSESTVLNHTVSKDIEGFKTSVTKNGGYYIGRYEARTTTERTATTDDNELGQIIVNANESIYNYVTQAQAAKLSREMYLENKKFTSDLINSYAWDTAILFIETFSENSNYATQTTLNDTLAITGTNNLTDTSKQDKICNIWDMASNVFEWTTESSNYSTLYNVNRGGSYNKDVDGERSTRSRYCKGLPYSNEFTSFRPILYINS